ncbi:MAG: cation:proton antiporter [Microbacteriaceae bacterium]
MHETTQILIEAGALLFGMSILGRIAGKFAISPIPVYLLLGLCFGPGGLVPFDASQEFFQVASEIGVILLLALLGLEYTAGELLGNLKQSRWAGLIDFALNALPGAALALLLGWGPVAALTLAGITWVSSSGVIAKVLRDLGRLGNRETPTVLSVLVIEDLAMAVYLPLLSAVLAGVSLFNGLITEAIALGAVSLILYLALRHGTLISKVFNADLAESLILGVLGLTMFVAGVASQMNVSAAVGAFLVGIALSGRVAENAGRLLTPLRDVFAAVFFVFFGITIDVSKLWPLLPLALLLSVVTIAGKVLTGYLAAKRAGIARPGRWRAGVALTPRGEFSIVIAGLAASAGVAPEIAPLAAGYVLITIIAGTFLARVPDAAWFKTWLKRTAPAS